MTEREEKIAALKALIESTDKEFGIDRTYTVEHFQKEMEAATPEERRQILIKALDNFPDMEAPGVREDFLKWSDQLREIRTEG